MNPAPHAHTAGPLTVSRDSSWPFDIITRNAAGDVVFHADMPCWSTDNKTLEGTMACSWVKDPSDRATQSAMNHRALADEILRAAAPDLLAALEGVREAFPHLAEFENKHGESLADLDAQITAALTQATAKP